MKKIIIICIALSFVLAASMAYAAASDCSTNPTGVTYQASKGVSLWCARASASYSEAGGHLQGDKTYGTDSGASVIYYTTKTAGTTYDGTGVDASGNTGAFSSWTSQ